MMNINETNELKGKISTNETQTPIQPFPYLKEKSEKSEFDALLNNVSDPSLLIQSIAMPVPIEFENFSQTETYNYDTKTIDNVDAMFFLNISNAGETVNIRVNDDTSVIDATNYKTMEVSKTLGDLILKAQENNKAVRLEFDNNVTVILRVASDGKIDTTFIPQSKEVENYLKNNIDYLKVRFDEQSIAYSNISYKPYKQNEKNSNNRKQGKNE